MKENIDKIAEIYPLFIALILLGMIMQIVFVEILPVKYWNSDKNWKHEASQVEDFFEDYAEIEVYEDGSFKGCFVGANCDLD